MTHERPPAADRPVVCVLSMHRSGSSALARLLNLIGVDLGPADRLLPPAPENPTGFWEHRELMLISDEILARLGGSWDEPPHVAGRWWDRREFNDLRTEALAIIGRDFASSPMWGWKDPRACLTLPFWQRLLPDLRFVFCLRNPLDVAASLHKRDDFSLAAGADLWLAYVASSFAHTAGTPRLVVWYDELIAGAADVADGCGAFLNRPVPDEARRAAVEFVAGDLRHHATPDEAVLQSTSVSPAVTSFFSVLVASRASGSVSPDLDRLANDLLASRIAGVGAAISPPSHPSVRAARLRLELRSKDTELRRLRNQLRDQHDAIEQQRAALAQKDLLVEDTQRQLAGQHDAIERQQTALAQKDALVDDGQRQLAEQHAALTAQQEALAALRTALEQKDALITSAQAQLAQQHDALTGLSESARDKDERIAAAERQLADALQETQRLAAVLRARAGEILSLRHMQAGARWQSEELQEKLATATEELAAARGVIDQVRQRASQLEAAVAAAQEDLTRVTASAAYQLAVRLGRLRQRTAPRGSRRERVLRRLLRPLGAPPRTGPLPRRYRPKVTLLLPAEGAAADAVLATVRSVVAQSDHAWQLVVTAGLGPDAAAALQSDPRIVVAPALLGDPAGPLNAALSIARGTFTGVLTAGDELTPDALRVMRRAMRRRRSDVLYSDESATHGVGGPAAVLAKPDWSPELLLAFPYTGRLCLMRTSLVRDLGGWRAPTLAAEEYDLVLAAARHGARLRRVPQTLYRRREPFGAVMSMPAAIDARRAALESHLAATGSSAVVVPDEGPGGLRVRHPIAGRPLVSIIIATRDRVDLMKQAIESIESRTTYAPYEIVIVDNDSREPETREYLDACGHRVVPCPGAFNFSRINNVGARAARGEYLIFLNNDTEVIAEDWIGAMLEWAAQPDIACVGAKLLFGDGRIQHAGVTLHDGSAFHNGYGERVGSTNWIDIELVRNFSAVTAACVMIRRELFLLAGGFDESFPVAYNDIEFCLRLRRRGYRHVYTPYAVLYHYESSSRRPGVARGEGEHLRSVVGRLLWHDPFATGGSTVAPPARVARTRTGRAFDRVARVSRRSVHLVRGSIWHAQSCRAMDVTRREPDDGSDAVRWMDVVEIGDEFRIGLFMHPVSSRTFAVQVPRGGRFRAWIALLPEVWDKNDGGALFSIAVEVDGNVARSQSWTIDPRHHRRHRRWNLAIADLSAFEGRAVEVTLATRLPPGAGPAHAWAVWGDPAVLERRSLARVVARQAEVVRTLGVRRALAHYAQLLRGRGPHGDVVYDGWFREQLQSACNPAKTRQAVARLTRRPRISIITPVYNTDPQWLRLLVGSVRAQIYPDWQLCLSDDGSNRHDTRATLEELALVDRRITVVRNATNRGISAASNAALDAATGEFVALLDHDDELSPNALLEVAKTIDAHPDADVIYTDEDKLELSGRHVEPFFKPDWSPEYLRSSMYIGHLTVYRRAIVDEAGRFRTAFDGSQDYDLALRVTERTDRIHHIPLVLYHWRKIPGSAAGQTDAKPWGLDASRRALADHIARLPIPATVEAQPGNGLWRVKYRICGNPLVSVVIPTDGRIARTPRGPRDLPLCCIRRIVERTTYAHYELVIVDNGRLSPELLRYLATIPHRRVVYEPTTPFNFASKLNFAAGHASGEHLLFLNDDTEVISDEWITAMLEFSQQPAIGAVGGKLFYPDGRLQHVGVVLGIGGGACHVFAGQPANSPGYFGSALVIRNYSAVTGACCMTRRDVFDEVGGFDERFATDFNDVDYCLRVRARGYRIVATPFAQLYHHEGATFGSREHIVNPAEVEALRERWAPVIAADPFYNRNLTRSSLDYRLRLDAV